ncbi:LacI family transcriptional regulator [Aeromicrobium sp. A1-2]|uniref:LacI family DNA-binding transcriptional regulator n=1 Tax=Aeromicrobium sp. A1-2 TaxID=2107713 RepID=UPI000E4D5017|nr:LacI family DNA-binding transcriptional regulator [Aeromicrobium sp. A1-2]AXT86280.1 LacI family transcriptional regulator [Aeromicrobium sp. A1-2]
MPDPAPEINMVDVARHAGVSIATVSRALRDVPGVSEATRVRIRLVAEDLSYVVSPEASALSRRATGRVAVVVPKIDVWFYSAMLAAIEGVLREADLDVLVYQVDGAAQRSRFFRQLPARRKVDAVVLIALPLPAAEEERLDLLGVHVVVAGGQLRDYPHVRADDVEATTLAMDHLLGLGHRRIAMIRTGDTAGAAWSADIVRTQTYRDRLDAHGITVPAEYLTTADAGPMAGSAGVDALLALLEPPTAILCYSDEIAVGAYAGLSARGIAVPGEISVIGIDGHPMAEVFDLSTVTQSVSRQGKLAGQMALDLLAGRPTEAEELVVSCDLIVRGSTGPPKV